MAEPFVFGVGSGRQQDVYRIVARFVDERLRR